MASIEEKLQGLWNLQTIDKKLDRLQSVRGELPMEVADLEDELAGLQTRLEKFEQEIADFESNIVASKEKIGQAQTLSKRYNEQLNKVKNNREYDALNKEIEIQGLEVLAAEKKIGELQNSIQLKNELVVEVKQHLEGRNIDLVNKKKELEEITAETEKEEGKISKERDKSLKIADEKLLKAYERIRKSVFNGLGVAPVLRGSCGGCFAKIPPQLQSDIRQRKKIVICEHCGRINVDADMAGIVEAVEEEKPKSRRRKKA
ncbi:MAG: putative nucleic acid-binding Zn-ribbon protein [Bacteroidia bacterium]|jgi:predicted  nucleic acid-binding Zn-ribbon protein